MKIKILQEKLGYASNGFYVCEVGASAGQPKLKRTRFYLIRRRWINGSERLTKSPELCFKRMCDFIDGMIVGIRAEREREAEYLQEIKEEVRRRGYYPRETPEKYYEELGRALAKHYFL